MTISEDMVERALAANVYQIQGFTYGGRNVIRDFRTDAGGPEIWSQENGDHETFTKRVAFEKMKAALTASLGGSGGVVLEGVEADRFGIEWFERTFGVPLGDMPGRIASEKVRARVAAVPRPTSSPSPLIPPHNSGERLPSSDAADGGGDPVTRHEHSPATSATSNNGSAQGSVVVPAQAPSRSKFEAAASAVRDDIRGAFKGMPEYKNYLAELLDAAALAPGGQQRSVLIYRAAALAQAACEIDMLAEANGSVRTTNILTKIANRMRDDAVLLRKQADAILALSPASDGDKVTIERNHYDALIREHQELTAIRASAAWKVANQ
jgi:hypothetical protein